ncbi:9464_t:CDS:2 [Paraglomus brasilianum]|uniref:9464_t:CDS:1 n=1 Tax=Paraglomus brasilianum TaxID=144538 RepID=A0A9N9BEE5_9GLOM|nr:9464_t:CDS:2 [Paraglomus brasilianum]
MSTSKTSKSVPFQGHEVSRNVFVKLYVHTVFMVILPIATYFYTSNYYYDGDSRTTKAAISAVVVANLVVFSFIITAFMEDVGDKKEDVRLKND